MGSRHRKSGGGLASVGHAWSGSCGNTGTAFRSQCGSGMQGSGPPRSSSESGRFLMRRAAVVRHGMASESDSGLDTSNELLAHLAVFRKMQAGIVGDGSGRSRIEEDPLGAAEQLAEYADFMVRDLRGKAKQIPRLNLIGIADLMNTRMPERTPLFKWNGQGFIYKDALYLGDGLTRAGKGMLVGAALPVALAAGGGWGSLLAVRPARAVLVTVEDTVRRLQSRIGSFVRGLQVDATALGDRLAVIARPRGGLQLDNSKHVDELLDLILPFKPDFLYLDNLARMSEADENTSDVRPAMEAADTIREVTGAATILVHHWGKDTDGRRGVHKSRGWSGIPGYVEAHLTVTRPEGSDTATLSHHDGKDDEDIALDFTLLKNGDTWTYNVAVAPSAGGVTPDAPRARVLAAVSSINREKPGGCTVTAIAASLALSERTVGEHLRALIELSAIRVDGKARSTRYYPPGPYAAGDSIGPPRDSREIPRQPERGTGT